VAELPDLNSVLSVRPYVMPTSLDGLLKNSLSKLISVISEDSPTRLDVSPYCQVPLEFKKFLGQSLR